MFIYTYLAMLFLKYLYNSVKVQILTYENFKLLSFAVNRNVNCTSHWSLSLSPSGHMSNRCINLIHVM